MHEMQTRKKRKLALGMALCLMFGTLPSLSAEAESLPSQGLQNGSFESVINGEAYGWLPDGSATAVTVSEQVYADGQRSLLVSDNSDKESYGAVSESVALSPFDNVVLTAKIRPEDGEGAKIDLRFYDEAGKLLSIVSGFAGGTPEEWKEIRVSASAPKEGASVQAAFYFPNEKKGLLYVDDVRLSATGAPGMITNLGRQSIALTIMTGAYGKDKNGRDVMYTVVQGDPAQFVVTDVLTNEVKGKYPLVAKDGSNASAAWGITVASDGKAYAGSTPNGTLFQFDPAAETVRTIGKPVESDTVIWTLIPGPDGKVYGGTGYSQSLFEYDPVTDKTQVLTSFKKAAKDEFIRSLAYDPDRNVIYAGGASIAKLYKYDLATKTSTELTIPEFSGKTSVYDLRYTAGKLFVRVDPGPVMYVYDPAANAWLVKNNTAYNTRGFSEASTDNRVFYTFLETTPAGKQQWSLYAYDVTTGTYGSLGVEVKGAGIAFGYINKGTPDETLVGLAGNSGRAFSYNLRTGHVETPELDLPPQFVELYNIGKSLDGKMLSSGFISGGGLGIYDPATGQTELKPSLGQVEGYGALNGKMYFGVYPNASIFEYDPSQPWNRTDPSLPNNPLRIGQLGNEQDRPVSLVGVDELNKLFIGTYPIAGKTGGALTIYDGATKTFTVKRNIVMGHSVNSLLYRNGKLYMGTSDMTGAGGGGKVAVYDIATGTIDREMIPAAGKKAVTSLIWGPDGNIWGMALGELFIYNPDSNEIVYHEDKFPAADYAHTNPRLMIGMDGNVYGSIFTGFVAERTYTGKMFKIDAASKEMTILMEGNVEKLAQDDRGSFYFKYGSELMRFDELTDIQFAAAPSVPLSVGESYQTDLKAMYANGSSSSVSKNIVYSSSDTQVADIAANGLITAKAAGTALITASYSNKQATFVLTVDAPPAPSAIIDKIEFSSSSYTIYENETKQTVVKAVYDDGNRIVLDSGVSFSSSNPAVADIDAFGLITARKAGSTVVKAVYGELSAEQPVTVVARTVPPSESCSGTSCGNNGGDGDSGGNNGGNGNGTGNGGTSPSAQVSEGKIRLGVSSGGGWTVTNGNLQTAVSQAASGVVEIEVPGENGEPVLLQLGAQGLKTAADGEMTLRIAAPGIRMFIPADALSGLPSDAETVELKIAAAGAEAESLVAGAVRQDGAYKASGITVTLELVAIKGGARNSVHQFEAPLTVELTIPQAQMSGIQKDFAGVYYVDGSRIEYMGGEFAGGLVRFDTDHFSAFAVLEYEKDFADMSDHWASAYVKKLAAKHIVQGVGDDRYAPELSVTRAEYVTMAIRGLGFNNPAADASFADVTRDAYYAGFVSKAAELGLAEGDNGRFRPEDSLTREEAVAVLLRLYDYLKLPASPAAADAASFSDMDDASEWAKPYIEKARKLGLIDGKGNNEFDPKGKVTRAEIAKILSILL